MKFVGPQKQNKNIWFLSQLPKIKAFSLPINYLTILCTAPQQVFVASSLNVYGQPSIIQHLRLESNMKKKGPKEITRK